ncbi:MAG TPA: sigma-70 family RNA polymerase sigma factor [Solirubrobacteraceae bacterium]
MEATALAHSSIPGLSRPSPLLRLQSDEKLVALTRRGQHAAFETLLSRYQSRLLSFCRHMLSSKEDAEDVLQEVFTAAFNAILADEREINVRPWLYRIARNRSLNHLRRASAIGVDSMDIHFAEGGISTGEKVLRRESFRQLIGDVQQLPETQRTALLLREIDALSYEQIAHAMETTVPSVKSLLVRARISLAEAAEARKLSCEEVRLELGEAAEGLVKLGAPARRHVRDCERCHDFKKHLRANNHALAAILPVGPLFMLKKLVLTKLGSTASAGSAHVAGGAGATAGAAGATAAAGAASAGGVSAGGILTAGAGALATKAVAGLAAAALVTAGAVAAQHSGQAHHRHTVAASASAAAPAAVPVVVRDQAQPPTAAAAVVVPVAALAHRRRHSPAGKPPKAPSTHAAVTVSNTHTASALATATAPVKPATAPVKPVVAAPVTQVTTETTELPTAATAQPQPSTPAAPATTPPAGETPAQPVTTPPATEEPAAATTPPSTAGGETSTSAPQTESQGNPPVEQQTGGTPAPAPDTATAP